VVASWPPSGGAECRMNHRSRVRRLEGWTYAVEPTTKRSISGPASRAVPPYFRAYNTAENDSEPKLTGSAAHRFRKLGWAELVGEVERPIISDSLRAM
jgi:hypothetical protein